LFFPPSKTAPPHNPLRTQPLAPQFCPLSFPFNSPIMGGRCFLFESSLIFPSPRDYRRLLSFFTFSAGPFPPSLPFSFLQQKDFLTPPCHFGVGNGLDPLWRLFEKTWVWFFPWVLVYPRISFILSLCNLTFSPPPPPSLPCLLGGGVGGKAEVSHPRSGFIFIFVLEGRSGSPRLPPVLAGFGTPRLRKNVSLFPLLECQFAPTHAVPFGIHRQPFLTLPVVRHFGIFSTDA